MARERILVVDDEPGVRRAVERIFGRRYTVTGVASGEEALADLAHAPYDLVLADVRMPGMDGLELLARVRKDTAADVIVMTGSAGEGDERLLRAIQGGAYFFLTKPFERAVIEALVERCLAMRRLARATQAHVEEVERSLEQARRFQASLLPRRVPGVPGALLGAHSRACERLGGDLYDFLLRPDDELDIFIADVSGHGVSAAMFTGIVKVAFRRLLWESRPEERAGDLYRDLRVAAGLMGPASFLTAIYAIYDPHSRRLTYWNAGHPSLVCLRDGAAPRWGESTMALVSPALPAAPLVTGEIALSPGERVLFYTDGLIDTLDPDGTPLGLDRVLDVLEAQRTASPAEALYRLEELVDAHRAGRPLDDDVTMVLLSLDTTASA